MRRRRSRGRSRAAAVAARRPLPQEHEHALPPLARHRAGAAGPAARRFGRDAGACALNLAHQKDRRGRGGAVHYATTSQSAAGAALAASRRRARGLRRREPEVDGAHRPGRAPDTADWRTLASASFTGARRASKPSAEGRRSVARRREQPEKVDFVTLGLPHALQSALRKIPGDRRSPMSAHRLHRAFGAVRSRAIRAVRRAAVAGFRMPSPAPSSTARAAHRSCPARRRRVPRPPRRPPPPARGPGPASFTGLVHRSPGRERIPGLRRPV